MLLLLLLHVLLMDRNDILLLLFVKQVS